MGRWIFVRHAQAVSNADGWLAGHRDAPLTEKGREQARAIAAAVATHAPVRAFTSDLVRARETARLACPPSCPIQVEADLRERNLGDWEGAPRSLLSDPEARSILLGFHSAPPGGESAAAVAQRLLTRLARLDTGHTQVVVSHGTALRATLGVLDGRSAEAIASWRISNASLHVREFPPGAFEDALRRLEEMDS